jgi:hypothetical protein
VRCLAWRPREDEDDDDDEAVAGWAVDRARDERRGETMVAERPVEAHSSREGAKDEDTADAQQDSKGIGRSNNLHESKREKPESTEADEEGETEKRERASKGTGGRQAPHPPRAESCMVTEILC